MNADETAIRALVEKISLACRAKNPDALAALYAPDAVAFDLVNPLQYNGSDALARRAREWFSSWQGDVTYEVSELSVVTAGEAAFCHSLNQVTGIKINGKKVVMWWRATLGCRKIAGRWAVTHMHSSVPFDMVTGKASLDITP